ncbi:glutathione S-transferase [Oxalobacteraceae bacterium]|nr:glutathione S-transferase [Oxalobacteraceae bacterium]
MIELHHLNASRSRRITWLLEELGLDYKLFPYERDAKTHLAPPELARIHPLGKAPVLCDDGQVLIESGAIIEYLVRTYGQGRFAPAPGTPEYNRYVQLLHYAEGSAMLPLMLKLYTGRLGEGGAPLQPRIDSEMANHLGYLDSELAGREYFVGGELSGADVQLSFVAQMALRYAGRDRYPNLTAFVDRIEARPAYQKAMAAHGA